MDREKERYIKLYIERGRDGEREDMKVGTKLWRTRGTSGKRVRVKGKATRWGILSKCTIYLYKHGLI